MGRDHHVEQHAIEPGSLRKAPASRRATSCRNCGALFTDRMRCRKHPPRAAEGVCVICRKRCCAKCGADVKGIFLCNLHWEYELHEGMARIFGTIDNVQSQFVAACLTQAGFHPFLYSRKFNPGSGMINSWVRLGIRNYGKHPIAEIKILVPFAEVRRAEKALRRLEVKILRPPA